MLNSRKRRLGPGVSGAAARLVSRLVATLLAATPISAHELSEASATLVVRDGGYVQLRLQIPWADVLHTAWMPGRPMQEFLVVATSKSRADFAKQFATVEQTIQRGTRLVADASAPVAFGRWQGATADEVYDALKRSHESERKLVKKLRETNQEIVQNAARVQQALKLSEEDAATIDELKKQI